MIRPAFFLIALLSSTALYAQTKSAAEAFGKREGIENISLSPDGTKIAYIEPAQGQGNRLFTVDLAGSQVPKAVLSASGDPERLNDCDWVSDLRLVCRIYAVSEIAGERISATRIIAINTDGSNLKTLSKKQGLNADRFAFFGGEVIDFLPLLFTQRF